MAVQQNSLKYFGGQQSGGDSSAKQVVIERTDMTAAFTEDEYQRCLSAISLGYAVAINWNQGGLGQVVRQLQLVTKRATGNLEFSYTRDDETHTWTVSGSSPHTISETSYEFDDSSITPVYNTGTKIADVRLDGVDTELYIPSGGGGGGDQFVLVRANMTTDFTNQEYQDCVDAVTAEQAVCVQFVMTGTTIQAQLTQITGGGTLVFEFTAEKYHYRWEVAATNNAHTVELTGKIFGVPIFDTLQDAITNEYTLESGDVFETNGFHTSGDGGAARYVVSTTGTANGMDIIQLAAGKLAVLQVQDFAYPDQLGYERDVNTTDVVPYIERIFALGILHIKLHWGRYYMRQTLNMPIASSIEGVARAAYDYPAMSRMLYMVNTGTCAINASNYDVCLENFDLYCSGNVSGKIGILTNSYDNSQRGLAFRNLKISGFETSARLEASANWNILFDRVTFESAQYGVYLNSSKLVINFSDCFFNGVYEECVHDCIYSSALSFSHCNFGCRKRVYKRERTVHNWRGFGEISFFGCHFEVDTYDLGDVSGCFVDVDDACQVSLTFVGCDFNADKGNPASLTCFKFGDISSAKFIGCHGKESKYVHYDGDFFDPNYPPEARPGSLYIDSNCVGLKKPTYDTAHSMSCIDERELYQSFTRVNALNLFDKDYADYSYAGVRDNGGGVLEFFTPPLPQSAATLVIDVPAYFRNRTLTISAPTGTHNRWMVVSTPIHPDQDRTQTPTLLADSYSTADNRDYVSFNMNGDRYLTFYYYLMNSDGEPEKFAMSEDLMLSDGNYHYPYVSHIIVEKRGFYINENCIAPVKITGRSGALPLVDLNDLAPYETGTRIFGEVNTFGGSVYNLPTGFSGFGTLDATSCVNGTRCIQRLIGGNGNMYVRRALRNTINDPWVWEAWKTFTGA